MQEPHVMALGFFDGVHIGHQFLLQQAKKIAHKNNCKLSVMTFDPHPSEIIKGETDRKYLTPLSSKLEEMSQIGVDKVFVMKFTSLFASLPASEFINQYIIKLHATHIVVGFDFNFGYKAQGNVNYLRNSTHCGELLVSDRGVVRGVVSNGSAPSWRIDGRRGLRVPFGQFHGNALWAGEKHQLPGVKIQHLRS